MFVTFAEHVTGEPLLLVITPAGRIAKWKTELAITTPITKNEIRRIITIKYSTALVPFTLLLRIYKLNSSPKSLVLIFLSAEAENQRSRIKTGHIALSQ